MILQGRDALYLDIAQLLRSVSVCWGEGLVLPTLIIIYTTIDLLATLDRPDDEQRSGRTNFCRWVDEFMLPHDGLAVEAIDIYGARCALLHNLSFASDLSRAGKARAFAYSWGKADHSVLELLLQHTSSTHVPVRVETLVSAFLKAVNAFRLVMEVADQRAERIFKRAESELFINIPPSVTGEASAG